MLPVWAEISQPYWGLDQSQTNTPFAKSGQFGFLETVSVSAGMEATASANS